MAKKPFPFSVCEQCCSDTDPAAWEQIEKELKNKVDKEEGKGLSTNDYDDIEKAKVGDTYEQVNRLWMSLDGTRQTVNDLSSNTLIVTKSNENTITDCAGGPVTSLNLYGYCTQISTPSPSSPAPIYPVEAPYYRGCGGDISTMNPDTLFGVPVASGGNYTDANGQQWICDEIDFVNRKYIKRCHMYEITGDEKFYELASSWADENTTASYFAIDSTYATINESQTSAQCLSTHLQSVKYGFADKTKQNCICLYYVSKPSNGVMAIRLENRLTGAVSSDSVAVKIEKIKMYIKSLAQSGNPIKVLYPLYTPVETEFTDEMALAEFTKMQTTYPSVTVESNANFLVGYNATVQGYVDKQIEKLTNAIISLGGNV